MIAFDLPGAKVAFTTREGGVSEGPYRSLNLGVLTADDPSRVARNRALVADAFGVEAASVAMARQVHGAEVAEWDRRPAPGARLVEADGHSTGAVGVTLLVLVADCLPVALVSPGRVAMLHCGWRGLAAGILERALVSFEEVPVAAVGPGIGRCCYEVGREVLDAVGGAGPGGPKGAPQRRMLDLRAVADARLRAAGVTRVEHADLCTSCRPDLFFSHRRDGGVTGRQAGIVERRL